MGEHLLMGADDRRLMMCDEQGFFSEAASAGVGLETDRSWTASPVISEAVPLA
jgi:hypothetical protein